MTAFTDKVAIVTGAGSGIGRAAALRLWSLGANVVIRGENGTVGAGVFAGGAHDLINNGRISADVAGGTITLNPSAGTTNSKGKGSGTK